MLKRVMLTLSAVLLLQMHSPMLVVAAETLLNDQYQQRYLEMEADPQAYLDNYGAPPDSRNIPLTLQRFLLRAEAYLLQQKNQLAIDELTSAIAFLENMESPNMQGQRAVFYERLADALVYEGDLSAARSAISKAIDNSELSEGQNYLIPRIVKRAEIDHLSGASIAALQDLQLALQLASTSNLKSSAIDIAMRMAEIHQQRNEHAIALSYSQLAIDTAEQMNDQAAVLNILITSMPSLLSNREFEAAQARLNQINLLLETYSQPYYEAKALQFAGELAYNQGDLDNAITKLVGALEMFKEEYPIELAHAHLFLSRTYTELDEMDLAINHLVDAFNAIPPDGNHFNLVQSINLHRAELLSSLNQFEEAYRVTKDVIAARDINQPIEEIKRMLDMHTNFQLQLQQQENIELKQKNAYQLSEIESKQTLNQLFFLVIALLMCISFLLLLMFIRSKKHRQSLELIAHTDALTGVYSRRRILEILDFQQDMFNRTKLPFCVAIVDLDYFKRINDQYGHQKGDEVLKESAKLAQNSFRKTDSVGRIGGEEFLFIFPDTLLSQGYGLLQKYCESLSQVGKNANIKQATTASIGLVQPDDGEAPSSIISRADKALYAAKNSGRNKIVSDSNNPIDMP
jgi:diguanylate cyclase (GGDEF)-like protein